VVRLFAFPVSLQTPLLRRLWDHIDRKTSSPSTGLDFARDRATHVLSVVQVTTGHDDDDVYLMGDVEAIENNATTATTTDDTHDSHDDWRIALYYIYRPIRDVMEQVDLHRSLCRTLDLCGRIRISHEGINGVLSGTLANLQEYERQFRRTIHDVTTGDPVENDDEIGDSYPHRLDMKYCRLRRDLPARDQLFDSLTVRETKTVINLFDGTPSPPPSDATNKSNRYRRRRERKRTVRQEHQPPKDDTSCTSNVQNPSPSLRQAVMDVPLRSATHLSSREWNAKLDDVHDPEKAILVDARNCYESRVGHFRHPTAPTLLTNTRKYSDLVHVLADDPRLRDDNRRKVFLYCTGGVRCERVGMLVRRLYPHKEVYQLKGGIQTYLKECHEGGSGDGTPMPSAQYFVGKNFVSAENGMDRLSTKCILCSPKFFFVLSHAGL
jgi:predicted sulfurtransferase